MFFYQFEETVLWYVNENYTDTHTYKSNNKKKYNLSYKDLIFA